MRQIVLASHNAHKAQEFRDLLAGIEIEVLNLDRFPDIGPVVEDGRTLEENALKKAREVFRKTGILSVADDTGLEVYYLHGEPGVYSSRYAGPDASYGMNCDKLLHALKGVPPRRRGAQFRCVLALVGPGGFERKAEGICRGLITEEPRGANGFGYDPLFIPSGHIQTFGEMDATLKNSLSHRALAVRNMKPILLDYFLTLEK